MNGKWLKTRVMSDETHHVLEAAEAVLRWLLRNSGSHHRRTPNIASVLLKSALLAHGETRSMESAAFGSMAFVEEAKVFDQWKLVCRFGGKFCDELFSLLHGSGYWELHSEEGECMGTK